MMADPRTYARHAAEQRQQRHAAQDDLDLLKPILERLEAAIAEVIAVRGYVNTHRAREALAFIEDYFHDFAGDTIGAAIQFTERALDDATPMAHGKGP